MARKTAEQTDPVADPVTAADPGDAPQAPAAPRPPQGIVVRRMETGGLRDFHPVQKSKRLIDPESLIVDGEPPYLALPIPDSDKVRVRQVEAKRAAYMLTCDEANGGAPSCRLATDEEVEAAKAEAAARLPGVLKSAEKDERRREKA